MWGGRTVGAMDGAIEPPWMGLRRVLTTHTAPPTHGIPPLPLLLPLQVQGAALPNTPLSCCAAECIRLKLHALLESI